MNKFQCLVALYRYYLNTGDWKTPSVIDCIRFTIQELTETDSALMKAGWQSGDHVRNNPLSKDDAMEQVRVEIGQAFVMLCTLANLLEIDLSEAGEQFLFDMHIKHAASASNEHFRIADEARWTLESTGDPGLAMAHLETLIHAHEEKTHENQAIYNKYNR